MNYDCVVPVEGGNLHSCRLTYLRFVASQSEVIGTVLRILSPLHPPRPKQAPSSSLTIHPVFYLKVLEHSLPPTKDSSEEQALGDAWELGSLSR